MQRSPRMCAVILACSCCLAAASAGATAIMSRFDSNNEGWAVVSYPFRGNGTGSWTTSALPFDGAEGQPAGSVRVGDVFAETGITAPPAYLGNMGAFYGGQLSYDILLRYSDAVAYPAVVLVGTTISLYYDAPSPPVGEWQTRTVPLTEAGWKVGGTFAVATQAQMQGVLQSLQGLHIYTEWHTGGDDTSVDNIVLNGGATPVPGAAAPPQLTCAPNPFNPRTTLSFTLSADGPVHLTIHDAAGRLVRDLETGALPAGRQEVVWDGCDDEGLPLASGVYLARLQSSASVGVARLVLVR